MRNEEERSDAGGRPDASSGKRGGNRDAARRSHGRDGGALPSPERLPSGAYYSTEKERGWLNALLL